MSFLLTLLLILRKLGIIFYFGTAAVGLRKGIETLLPKLENLYSSTQSVIDNQLAQFVTFYSKYDATITSVNDINRTAGTDGNTDPKDVREIKILRRLYNYIYGVNPGTNLNDMNVEMDESFINPKDLEQALGLWSLDPDEDSLITAGFNGGTVNSWANSNFQTSITNVAGAAATTISLDNLNTVDFNNRSPYTKTYLI